jgi:hypothetical protein
MAAAMATAPERAAARAKSSNDAGEEDMRAGPVAVQRIWDPGSGLTNENL